MIGFRIAFRNIRKNRRRTAITLTALAVGYLAISLFQGYVADTLHALQEDADALAAAQAARRSAEGSFAVARRQHDLGQAPLITALTAEQTLRATQQAEAQAQAQRLSDTAALYQALGG